MLHSEFESQFVKLKLTYSDKAFPPIREQMFWERYRNAPLPAFEAAVDWIVLSMPPLSAVIGILDERLGMATKPPTTLKQPPDNPRAREHAKVYGENVRKLLKNGAGLPLPYDPKKREGA